MQLYKTKSFTKHFIFADLNVVVFIANKALVYYYINDLNILEGKNS